MRSRADGAAGKVAAEADPSDVVNRPGRGNVTALTTNPHAAAKRAALKPMFVVKPRANATLRRGAPDEPNDTPMIALVRTPAMQGAMLAGKRASCRYIDAAAIIRDEHTLQAPLDQGRDTERVAGFPRCDLGWLFSARRRIGRRRTSLLAVWRTRGGDRCGGGRRGGTIVRRRRRLAPGNHD